MPDLMQILVSAVVFAGVLLPIIAVFGYPPPAAPPVHRQIAAALGQGRDTVFESALFAPFMNIMLAMARRIGIVSLRDKVRQDLDASGNPSGYTVDEYLAVCMACSVGLGVLMAAIDILLGSGLVLLSAPMAMAIGFGIPLVTLGGAADRRVGSIGKQLPYTLDLIALTMSAGASFSEAIETLIRDDPEQDMNQELQIALSEIEFGATRATALANLGKRIPLESLHSVIAAINQAELLGTPLSTILKLQSDMLRMHRGVRAEKLSASASLRILVPSTMILMAVVVIVFSPMIIRAIRGELL